MQLRYNTPYSKLIEIVKEKYLQLQNIMEEENLNTWLIFVRETAANPDPVQNLVIGGDVVWESAFIFHLDQDLQKIAIVGNFDAEAEKNKDIWDEVIPYTEGISEILVSKFEQLNPEHIALNYSRDDVIADGLSHGLYLKLEKLLEKFKTKFISAQPLISKLRARKTVTEIELIKQSCELTEEINDSVIHNIKVGMSEIEIQEMYHRKMDSLGVIEAWEREGCPAIDAGPEKEMGHIGPSKLKAQKGHTLHNDFGVQLHGYCSDLQRMWFFGTENELPDQLRKAFDTVHGAITAASNFITPGVKGYEIDKIARDFVLSQGYDEYKHALGHQVGTKAHDGGVLLGPLWERYGDLPKGVVEEGNVFTLELYVRTEDYGMVSLEEDIVVTSDGCEFLVPRQEDWFYLN